LGDDPTLDWEILVKFAFETLNMIIVNHSLILSHHRIAFQNQISDSEYYPHQNLKILFVHVETFWKQLIFDNEVRLEKIP